jgi:hypothetical protein
LSRSSEYNRQAENGDECCKWFHVSLRGI